MSAYNSVNGATMSQNPLLAEPLKGEWGFDGLVVSDWGALRSTVPAALAAQDLAMPGPNEPWGAPLVTAVRDGVVPEAMIDEKLRRLLLLAERVGALDDTGLDDIGLEIDGSQPLSMTEARALLRHAVTRSSVLVRNEEGLLPLDAASLRNVAVIGPNAATARIQGGGSASVFPASTVTPLAGIRAALEGVATVEYAAGAHVTVRPTPLSPGHATDPITGEPGVRVRYLDADGAEVHSELRRSGRILEPSVDFSSLGAQFVEVSAHLTPEVSGEWKVGVVGLGDVSLRADGKVLIDETVAAESDDPTYLHVTPSYRQAPLSVDAGVVVELAARRRITPETGLAIALTADPPRRDADDELAAAVALAKSADAAIVVVGTTDEIESEGFDRASLALPGRQDELVAAVVAVNPRTIVVVNAGGPVLLPWLEDVPAALLSWFPGQEAGDGLADLLFGVAEPGGRLPTTWGASAADVPILDTAPVKGTLDYAEGLHIGYRAWLRARGVDRGHPEPMFWFGHGLGYTSWRYEAVSAPSAVEHGQGFTVDVTVRNSGHRAGREVVQVYVSRTESAIDRPARWLAGFATVEAKAGEEVTVAVEVPARALQHWSVSARSWSTEPGEFTLLVGRSAGDLPLSATIAVD
jgi:beta-glucosidase